MIFKCVLNENDIQQLIAETKTNGQLNKTKNTFKKMYVTSHNVDQWPYIKLHEAAKVTKLNIKLLVDTVMLSSLLDSALPWQSIGDNQLRSFF